MTEERRQRYIYRLPPCPGYDVDGMEQWLDDAALRGRHLEKDGFFAGVAKFALGSPRAVRYRLSAAQKSTSMWADNMGEPDEDEVELSRKYGWEYVTKRGDFYIYRTEAPGVRELNTDPEVQALALESVKKRAGSSCVPPVLWGLIFFLALHWSSFLLTMLSLKTWYFLLTVLLVGSSVAESVRTFRAFRRMQRELREEGQLQRRPLHPRRYYGKLLLDVALVVLWAVLGLHMWSDDMLDVGRIPLSEFDGQVPFATMETLAGGDVTSYEESMTGLRFNSVAFSRDLLAPSIIQWRQHAALTTADGSTLDGGLYVTYYQMRSSWLAERLARGILRDASHQDSFQPAETPPLEADFAAVYYDLVHSPNLVVQKGELVVKASFLQFGSEAGLSSEAWMTLLVDSLRPS